MVILLHILNNHLRSASEAPEVLNSNLDPKDSAVQGDLKPNQEKPLHSKFIINAPNPVHYHPIIKCMVIIVI